ncbi:ATP-dependent helicase, partial [Bacillus vallismortis]|nr:ATP-dependent helicase [Bacillus vallismortis]
ASFFNMFATTTQIDHSIVRHPDFFFKSSTEYSRINPVNLIIFVDHLKSAAYELHFKDDEEFDPMEISDNIEKLQDE